MIGLDMILEVYITYELVFTFFTLYHMWGLLMVLYSFFWGYDPNSMKPDSSLITPLYFFHDMDFVAITFILAAICPSGSASWTRLIYT